MQIANAITRRNTKVFSNRAGDTQRFYFVAPGVNIYSTYAFAPGYASLSGTSMGRALCYGGGDVDQERREVRLDVDRVRQNIAMAEINADMGPDHDSSAPTETFIGVGLRKLF